MSRLRLASILCLVAATSLWLSCGTPPETQPSPAPAAAPEPPPQAAGPDMPRLMDKLGDYHRAITTSSALAQRYFDQGMVLTFGFNHDAAKRSFQAAAQLDPDCASCYWGIALSLGPNINMPMGPDAGRKAYEAIRGAQILGTGNEVEQALIAALATRYAAEPPEDRSALDAAYAEAMTAVQASHPDDVDLQVLLAEALMDLYPWNYWTEGGQPREHTLRIQALLEGALAAEPTHVGANHYYIHAMEEYFPEKAVAAADRLGDLAPDAGHLVHMPSHIYWRVGRYDDALEINQRAAAADEDFFSWCSAGAFYQALYYPHNIHFLWAAASAEGRSEIALSAARKLASKTEDGMGDMAFLQEFVAVPMQTLVRFGRWDAVLGEPKPAEGHRYLVAIWHYTRGVALLRTGDLAGAEAELASVRAIAAEDESEALILAGGTASARSLLEIGLAHLDGELRAARGDLDGATESLAGAVAKQDALVYMEPPPWYFPTRQALGAVLLDAGRAEEAAEVYRKDLEMYPRNGWSLYGLSQSLRSTGRDAEAAWAEQGFRSAWARADVELSASRF
jgi:tetratricopeptide (TPR) repeat protein